MPPTLPGLIRRVRAGAGDDGQHSTSRTSARSCRDRRGMIRRTQRGLCTRATGPSGFRRRYTSGRSGADDERVLAGGGLLIDDLPVHSDAAGDRGSFGLCTHAEDDVGRVVDELLRPWRRSGCLLLHRGVAIDIGHRRQGRGVGDDLVDNADASASWLRCGQWRERTSTRFRGGSGGGAIIQGCRGVGSLFLLGAAVVRGASADRE